MTKPPPPAADAPLASPLALSRLGSDLRAAAEQTETLLAQAQENAALAQRYDRRLHATREADLHAALADARPALAALWPHLDLPAGPALTQQGALLALRRRLHLAPDPTPTRAVLGRPLIRLDNNVGRHLSYAPLVVVAPDGTLHHQWALLSAPASAAADSPALAMRGSGPLFPAHELLEHWQLLDETSLLRLFGDRAWPQWREACARILRRVDELNRQTGRPLDALAAGGLSNAYGAGTPDALLSTVVAAVDAARQTAERAAAATAAELRRRQLAI